MNNTIQIPEHQESIFEKMIGPLNDYNACKLRIQQLRLAGKLNNEIEAKIEARLAASKIKMGQILNIYIS